MFFFLFGLNATLAVVNGVVYAVADKPINLVAMAVSSFFAMLVLAAEVVR